MTTEEIQKWVKDAMASKDAEYQLVEVVRTAIELTYTECIEITKLATIPGHSVQAPTCESIAQKIRERAGFVVVPGLPARKTSVPGEQKQ